MNIFVINNGSSSIKYQLFKMPGQQPVCSGLVERISLTDGQISHKTFVNGQENQWKETGNIPTHEAGLLRVVALLTTGDHAVIKSPDEIEVVGHRVVHGGENFKATTIISDAIKEKIKQLFSLAPLHNPANYLGIEIAEKIFSGAKQVAVFDTAFHQSMAAEAFRYAIPKSFYTDHRIRAYGFHGTSHKYVSRQATAFLHKPDAKLISIHLGNGCSIAAVAAEKSIDTSMGFGPLSGLVMGTRSGDIDGSVIFHLVNQLGYSLQDVNDLLNKKSGMQGLTGLSDMRDINKAAAEGNEDAVLAIAMYVYRIKKYIGAYAAVLNGLDAIVFTAGVGENAANIREAVCSNMQYLGIHIDGEKNQQATGALREINTPTSPVKILVIATNEELEIARQCYDLMTSETKKARTNHP
ncbi:MAG: acetate kinase [Chitinophagaceae bacterium]|nr:MAG: acetate kinase [Chitinophagaceae bacterium]